MPSKDSLVANLPPITGLIRGSLVRYFHEGCRCHPKGRYGPYWYLSVNQGGRTRMRKLKDHQVAQVRWAVKNYNLWWKTCLRIFETNTERLLAQEG